MKLQFINSDGDISQITQLESLINTIFEKFSSIDIDEKKVLEITIINNEYTEGIKAVALVDSLDKIRLSGNYCKFLWLICDISIRIYDSNILELKKEEKCIDTAQSCEESYTEISDRNAVFRLCYKRFNIAIDILKGDLSDEEIEYLGKMNVNSFYASRTNTIYSYGIIFIILHEYAHIQLNHSEETKKNDEKEADMTAFFTLYTNVEQKDKITAMVGVLSAITSLFFIDGDLKGGPQHDDDDIRLLNIMKIITDEYPNYKGYLYTLFRHWAYVYQFEDFPSPSETYETSFDDAILFLEKYKKQLCK